MGKLKFLAVLIVTFILAGCFYHDKNTDLDYMLHTEYEIFDISKNPNVDLTKFLGFCMMPLDKEDDERGKTCVNLLTHYLKEKGYIEVQREELVAEPKLVPNTALVGIGYNESYMYGTIQLEINAYEINKKGGGDMVWSWKAKFDGYPVCQRTIEPALKDLFNLEPVNYDKHEPIYKKPEASTNDVEKFMVNLARARKKLKEQVVDTTGDK